MYSQMAKANPKLRRAMVWCVTCNHRAKVNVAECLAKGWPKCCGYTMTLDSPEERRTNIRQHGEAHA